MPRIVTESEVLTRGRILQSIGRIADGIEIDAARAELSALAEELDTEAAGASARGWGAQLVPLKDEMIGASREALLGLLAAVVLVLLVACANLSNLMLARGSARATELAVRASLGSGRGRLIRHLLAEAALISALGAMAGLTLAVWGTRALVALDPSVLPRETGALLDGRVLAFTLAISAAAALLFGLVPA